MAQPPKQWLNALRLQAARKLLVGGGSVKEAVLSFGYKRPQHFSQDFTKFFDFAPSLAHALQPIDGLKCASDETELV